MDQHETRTRADQHKFLPQLACIKPTLLFVEYYPVFGQFFENEFENVCRACRGKSIDG